ncbi:1b366457-867b-4bff-bd34-a0dd23525ea1 [Thermothielavioides terrestris]|uniref:1b366457-867b-4bff-bd34-a0dd23525ea1 n=1 Tax=Thermothielavioides terrestris TaxID=2587410 RepID=A0A446BEC7_9PEZI|nr:1b366457-867b-4bff-bd34-a0dd23525ea1 [Thermothielavioides terrestris]
MDATASGQANDVGASHPASERKDVPIPPGITEAARQACDRQVQEDKKLGDQAAESTELNKNTAASDQANQNQASRLPPGAIAIPFPPGMTLEAFPAMQEAKRKQFEQYLEERKLADETAKNTELNKNITISDQT